MPGSLFVVEARRYGNGVLTAARAGVETLSKKLVEIRDDRLYSEEVKLERVADALGKDGASIRGAIEDGRQWAGIQLQAAEARVVAVRQVAPEALSERREALGPFLARAFEDWSGLIYLYRNNFEDPAARRVLEDHVELFTASGNHEATPLAEEWRRLQEELAPQRPEAELQALEDRDALSELADYLEAGAVLVHIALSGLEQNGELSAQQLMDRASVESMVNEFESKHLLPSSQPGAMDPSTLQQLLDGQEAS